MDSAIACPTPNCLGTNYKLYTFVALSKIKVTSSTPPPPIGIPDCHEKANETTTSSRHSSTRDEMAACIFCKIVKGTQNTPIPRQFPNRSAGRVASELLANPATSGDIPSFKLLESEKILAYLDIQPLSKGHTVGLGANFPSSSSSSPPPPPLWARTGRRLGHQNVVVTENFLFAGPLVCHMLAFLRQIFDN